ncbi:iron ABC transporter substrate-binding protein [Neomicrococcus aestuarii]|nr:iron ABC transporter substrate-binding protein [Neomicrococcus aestuarii]
MKIARTVALSAAVLALGMTTACAGSSTQSTSSTAASSSAAAGTAAGDQKIVLYSGRNEKLVQPLIDQFTTKTGIEVEVRYGNTSQMAAQLLEEGDRSPADLFLAQDAGALGAVANKDLFQELSSETLELVPEKYRDVEDQWVGVTGRARVLAYNPDLVKEADLPKTVEELNGSEYKGKVGIAPTNASFQSFITAMRVLEGDDAAEQYLSDLAGNSPEVREGNGDIVKDIDAGKIPFGLVNHYYVYEIAHEKGIDYTEMNVKNYLFPEGNIGSLVNVSGAGIIKHTKDDEAQQLLDFFLSEDGQKYFAETTFEYPLIEGAPTPEGMPELEEIETPDVDLNKLEDLETTIKMITSAGLA